MCLGIVNCVGMLFRVLNFSIYAVIHTLVIYQGTNVWTSTLSCNLFVPSRYGSTVPPCISKIPEETLEQAELCGATQVRYNIRTYICTDEIYIVC